MARQVDTDHEATRQLWSRLGDTRTGFLWLPDTDQHPQPMTHFADHATGVLWFVTSADTDLARALGHGAQARFAFQSHKGDYHASLVGALEVSQDTEQLDALWSAPIAAWFERGREDPRVRLLRFTPREAAIWASDGNPVLTGLKLLNAAMREGVSEPDVGVHRVIELHAA